MVKSMVDFLNRKNNALYIVILIQTLIIYGAFVVISQVKGGDFFLSSDGYYEYADIWVTTGKLPSVVPYTTLAPGLPVLLSSLFIFPDVLHPFLRVTYSLLFAIGSIIIVYRLSKNYFSNSTFLIGSFFFLFNIVWIHFTIKLTPEVFISFLLGFYIYLTINYTSSKKLKYLLYANLIFFISVFTKPVLLLIPFTLLLYSFFNRKLFVYALVGSIVCLFSFWAYTNFTNFQINEEKITDKSELEGYNSMVKGGFIRESFWYDFMINTGQFHKGMKQPYREGHFRETGYKEGNDYIKKYFEENPESGFVDLHLTFFKEHPWMAIQNIIVSPVFFFIIGTTPLVTILIVITTIITWLFLLPGIKKIYETGSKENKEKLLTILIILIGYSLPYLVFHAYSRYSHSLIPFLYVWCGGALLYFNKWRELNSSDDKRTAKL